MLSLFAGLQKISIGHLYSAS